tara:strand:- start:199 stop:435 length:237 start_codon:yes stop_codon:yes gene_type:complete
MQNNGIVFGRVVLQSAFDAGDLSPDEVTIRPHNTIQGWDLFDVSTGRAVDPTGVYANIFIGFLMKAIREREQDHQNNN